jgi:hypothetical protein
MYIVCFSIQPLAINDMEKGVLYIGLDSQVARPRVVYVETHLFLLDHIHQHMDEFVTKL